MAVRLDRCDVAWPICICQFGSPSFFPVVTRKRTHWKKEANNRSQRRTASHPSPLSRSEVRIPWDREERSGWPGIV